MPRSRKLTIIYNMTDGANAVYLGRRKIASGYGNVMDYRLLLGMEGFEFLMSQLNFDVEEILVNEEWYEYICKAHYEEDGEIYPESLTQVVPKDRKWKAPDNAVKKKKARIEKLKVEIKEKEEETRLIEAGVK